MAGSQWGSALERSSLSRAYRTCIHAKVSLKQVSRDKVYWSPQCRTKKCGISRCSAAKVAWCHCGERAQRWPEFSICSAASQLYSDVRSYASSHSVQVCHTACSSHQVELTDALQGDDVTSWRESKEGFKSRRRCKETAVCLCIVLLYRGLIVTNKTSVCKIMMWWQQHSMYTWAELELLQL